MAPMVRHRFRVEALQALHPEPRLELLEGEVYEMAPPSSEDAGLLDGLLSALTPKAAGRAQLRGQNPLRLSEESLPLADLLLKPREDFYTEVSLSTAGWEKLPLYAQAGLPKVWLLTREGLEVHREPEEGRFPATRGERVAPLLLPEAERLFRPPL